MRVIGFCGLPGSGKSTAIEAIKDLGIVITMGDVIRNEARKRGLEPTDENLGRIAKEIRENGGPEIVAEKCVELIQEQTVDLIIIDGLRSMAEVAVFRRSWKFPIIATVLKEEERFKRLALRGRSDDPKFMEDLKIRDHREIQFGLQEVIENADYYLSTEPSIETFIKQTRDLVDEILQDYEKDLKLK